MNTINQVARKSILDLSPYRSARSLNTAGNVFLDANENPFDRVDKLNRYPEPQPSELKLLLSTLYKVTQDSILITRGSDEGIDLLIRACCEAGRDSILITPPTYGMYAVSANIQGAQIMTAPLLKTDDFSLDVERLISSWQPNIKIVFLCSPNNPTGTLLENNIIVEICRKMQGKALVVVDEAYIEFAEVDSVTPALSQFDNLVVLRTLSKAYGLAGARVGAILANQPIINLLKKIIAPYPIATPVVQSVLACLLKQEQQIKLIVSERERLKKFLLGHPLVEKIYSSSANFLLVQVTNPNRWMTWCAENKIILRNFDQYPLLNGCVRISIGTPAENQLLEQVLIDV